MSSTIDKVYKSRREAIRILFLVAYILSVAARNEFLLPIFGYLALIPVAINFVLLVKNLRIVSSINQQKLRRRRMAGLIFEVLVNLFIATLILWE